MSAEFYARSDGKSLSRVFRRVVGGELAAASKTDGSIAFAPLLIYIPHSTYEKSGCVATVLPAFF